MKILFLDFDGVLNSEKYYAGVIAELEAIPARHHSWWEKHIDPRSVHRLNQIVWETGALVVVSSSWRLKGGVEYLQGLLNSRGFAGKVISVTPNDIDVPRSGEITQWLDANSRVDEFVIIDDDEDAEIDGHFVLTSEKEGLTDKDVAKAIGILLSKNR
jgi:hypothetical protein